MKKMQPRQPTKARPAPTQHEKAVAAAHKQAGKPATPRGVEFNYPINTGK